MQQRSSRSRLACHRQIGVRRPKIPRACRKAIFYDFESYHDKTQRKKVTNELTYENPHVPISVSLGDTLQRVPKHICDPNPKELIREEIYGRASEARKKISAEFISDIHLFTATINKGEGEENENAGKGRAPPPPPPPSFFFFPEFPSSSFPLYACYAGYRHNEQSSSREKVEHNDVHKDKRLPFRWHYKLSWPGTSYEK